MSEVALLASMNKGWSLTEIKDLSQRERRHWINVGLWQLSR